MKQIYFSYILMLAFISISNAQPGLEPDTIFVSPGWNLIGSKFTGAVSDIVTTEPQGIITSPFWKFSPGGNIMLAGYSMADTLEESSGYWVKISIPGFIFVSPIGRPFVCGHILFGKKWYASKLYSSVQIGSQCWLKPNLDIGEFRLAYLENQDNDGVMEKYCYYEDESNCSAYGGLYQWGEAMQYVTTEGAKGICPLGWHIPTYQEFLILKSNVSDDGNALKSIGHGTGAGAGTNTSKFSALLAGIKGVESAFYGLGETTNFWSSSTLSSSSIYFMSLEDDNANINLLTSVQSFGYSIRCIKND